ncbi:MAG: WD40/YVTN/BNR-like repeat-containing protein [Pyrinomonadaceae bacterium]
MRSVICVLIVFVSAHAVIGQWIKQTVDTTASLRGLSVVNEKVVWASGTGGTVIRTIDGGKTWKVMTVTGADKLDFRDIEAFDANTAYILSIGNGESSRIYKTTDGGATWKEQFRNKNEKAFYDAIACWDRNNCIAMSDPVDGKFVLINTKDGGATWRPMDTDKMPSAKEGEAAFAASGTCLITQGKNNVFLVTGGSAARVFRSNNRGLTWFVADTPIVSGTQGSGIFSIAMRDAKNGVIVGGNYERPDERNNTVAMTLDGGATWRLVARLKGYRSAVAYLDQKAIISVGTNGTDFSFDRRMLWKQLGKENMNAVIANGRNAIWAVGPNGRVSNFDPRAIPEYERFDPNRTDYPHVVNIDALRLSHRVISTTCAPSDAECSSNPKITVQAVAMGFVSPHEYLYTVTAGTVLGDKHTVEWDLLNVKPGTYTITAAISIPAFLSSSETFWGVYGRTETVVVVVK